MTRKKGGTSKKVIRKVAHQEAVKVCKHEGSTEKAARPRRQRKRKSTAKAAASVVPASKSASVPEKKLEAVIKEVQTTNSAECAAQMLDPEAAILSGKMVAGPLDTGQPVHVWHTETSIDVPAVDVTGGASSMIRVFASPSPAYHVRYATAIDATGAPTASTAIPAEGQAAWAAQFDDLHLCAMAMKVKYSGLEDKANGMADVRCYNPETSAISANYQSQIDEPGLSYPPAHVHYSKVSWLPMRKEYDFAFIDPTTTSRSDATDVIFQYKGLPSAQAALATYRVTVLAIWAGRVDPDQDTMNSRVFSIDPEEVERHIQASLMKLPQYAQGRIMFKDDGIIDDVARGLTGIQELGSGNPLRMLGGAVDIVRSVGSVWDSIGSFFSLEEKVVRLLYTIPDEQKANLLALLTEDPTREELSAMIDGYRRQRRSSDRNVGFREIARPKVPPVHVMSALDKARAAIRAETKTQAVVEGSDGEFVVREVPRDGHAGEWETVPTQPPQRALVSLAGADPVESRRMFRIATSAGMSKPAQPT